MSDPTGWLAAKPNAPLSTGAALAAICAAPAVLLFVSRPHIFHGQELGKLILLCAGIGFPIVALCAMLCILVFHCLAEWNKPITTMSAGDLVRLANDPPLEWAALWTGSSLAHLIFYGLSAYAVFYTFRLARTLLAVAAALVVLSLLVYLAVVISSYLHRHSIRPPTLGQSGGVGASHSSHAKGLERIAKGDR
jgi:hypothetical protein